jgi:hypothetical protein
VIVLTNRSTKVALHFSWRAQRPLLKRGISSFL